MQVGVGALLDSSFTEKRQVTTKEKPGRNVRKEMYDPFPPYNNVRPTTTENASLQ